MKIVLLGHVPSKKDRYRVGKKHLYLEGAVSQSIDSLILQARSQWKREPLEHPNVRVWFYVRSRRMDKNNLWSTIADVLQKAGVIKNDNISHFNGRETIEPAVMERCLERTVIELEEI